MEDQAPSPTAEAGGSDSPFILHFRCFDRKGRQGEKIGRTYDLYLCTDQIVAVRAGFMPRPKSDFDAQLDAMASAQRSAMLNAGIGGGLYSAANPSMTVRAHSDDPLDGFEPDPTRATIIMSNGDKHMVECPLPVAVARVMQAKRALAMIQAMGC